MKSSVLLCLMLVAATASAATAQFKPAQVGSPTVTFVAKTTNKAPANDKQSIGTNGFIAKDLTCSVDNKMVGRYLATGTWTDTAGETLLNWVATIDLKSPCGKFPAGKIFLVGDGTGPSAPSTLDKAIVGGTGPFVGKLGIMKVEAGKTNLYFVN